MTGEEFIFLSKHASNQTEAQPQPVTDTERKYVYGILGIAKLFGCSLPTANRIKKSGKIDKAITQIGRKIIVDAELALELAGKKTGGRKITGGVLMDYMKDNKEISAEEAVILWQASRLSLSKSYEKAPEILKVHGSVIGTLGNFSASIGKAKKQKDVQCVGYRSCRIEEWYGIAICGGTSGKTNGKSFMWTRNRALIIA